MGRRPSLSSFPVASIESELRRRRLEVGRLLRRHRTLMRKAAAIEQDILLLGGSLGARAGNRNGQTRPRNSGTLVEALARILDGKTMSVTDVAAAVQNSGYKTNSSHFRTQVNIALSKSGKFKRVARGQYTAKA